jgi:hypothetical protein
VDNRKSRNARTRRGIRCLWARNMQREGKMPLGLGAQVAGAVKRGRATSQPVVCVACIRFDQHLAQPRDVEFARATARDVVVGFQQ